MTEVILTLAVVIPIFVVTIFYLTDKAYWKGRFAGWDACENMAIQRAKDCNYPDSFWEDIFQ
jgi:hypothetical protein